MKNIFLFLFIAGILFACNSGDPYRKSRKIYEQTMTIHDEVMPKMGEVLSLKHSLKMKIDSVSDEVLHAQIDSAMSSLDRVYNGMMSWMADLQPVPDKNSIESTDKNSGESTFPSPDEMTNIQQKSLDEIMALKEKMNKSIQNGKVLLSKL